MEVASSSANYLDQAQAEFTLWFVTKRDLSWGIYWHFLADDHHRKAFNKRRHHSIQIPHTWHKETMCVTYKSIQKSCLTLCFFRFRSAWLEGFQVLFEWSECCLHLYDNLWFANFYGVMWPWQAPAIYPCVRIQSLFPLYLCWNTTCRVAFFDCLGFNDRWLLITHQSACGWQLASQMWSAVLHYTLHIPVITML